MSWRVTQTWPKTNTAVFSLSVTGFDVNVRCQEADEFIAENEGLWGKIFFFPDKMGNTERNILPGNAVVTV